MYVWLHINMFYVHSTRYEFLYIGMKFDTWL
jgi:hypothetical protein